MAVQPLGLTHRDMIDQSAVDALNTEAKELIESSNNQITAEIAIDRVADSWGFVVVEADGGTTLIRNADGQYAVIWYESQFGQAFDIFTAEDYDNYAVGFDDQTLGWSESE